VPPSTTAELNEFWLTPSPLLLLLLLLLLMHVETITPLPVMLGQEEG